MLRQLLKSAVVKFNVRKFSECESKLIQVSDEVHESISHSKPLLALESTVITHGMPWPINLETALELESIVRRENVTPVTIGVMNGKIKAGFSLLEMEELAQSFNSPYKPLKVSRQNIYSCRNIKYGGTTVSGTIIIAHKLGIEIFATGGVGGVHRGVENSMDISADLRELGRTSICVVSSGIKSFLDIPKTLEYLETEGVFVCTLDSDVFPNFFTRSSGIKSPNNLTSFEQIALILQDMMDLKINSGLLVAIPIPKVLEKYGQSIQQAIIESLENAKSAGITGKDITPYVLNQINLITQGQSLMLNVELIKNNAQHAAKLVTELHKLRGYSSTTKHSKILDISTKSSSFAVIGGSIVDVSTTIKDKSVVSLETVIPCGAYDCNTSQTCGGVGRNLSEVFSRLNEKCHFFSVLGKDYHGEFIMKNSQVVDLSQIFFTDHYQTANCSIISCQNREILFHTGNFSIFESVKPDHLKDYLMELKDSVKLICLDCNFPEETIEFIIDFSKQHGIKIFLEPTDVLLVKKPLKVVDKLKQHHFPVDIISPNILEFTEIIKYIIDGKEFDFKFNINTPKDGLLGTFEFVKRIMTNSNLLDFIPIWIIKLGSAGVVFASKEQIFFLKQSMFFIPRRRIVKMSGAGDCLLSCALLLHFRNNLSWKDSLTGGMRLVKESLMNIDTVPKTINSKNYTEKEIRQWIKEMLERKLFCYRE